MWTNIKTFVNPGYQFDYIKYSWVKYVEKASPTFFSATPFPAPQPHTYTHKHTTVHLVCLVIVHP